MKWRLPDVLCGDQGEDVRDQVCAGQADDPPGLMNPNVLTAIASATV